jgi:hypothetical protein
MARQCPECVGTACWSCVDDDNPERFDFCQFCKSPMSWVQRGRECSQCRDKDASGQPRATTSTEGTSDE